VIDQIPIGIKIGSGRQWAWNAALKTTGKFRALAAGLHYLSTKEPLQSITLHASGPRTGCEYGNIFGSHSNTANPVSLAASLEWLNRNSS
jgi:hypothetical protein